MQIPNNRNTFIGFADDISSIYNNIEYDLLVNIANKLNNGSKLIKKLENSEQQYLDWQFQMLKDLQGLDYENAKIVAKYSNKTVEEIERIFNEGLIIGTKYDENLMQKATKIGLLNPTVNITDDLTIKAMLNIAKNNTLTTLNSVNNTMIKKAGTKYVDIINKISSQVMAGTKTYTKALEQSITGMNSQGIPVFVDKIGREWKPEGYINMLIKTDMQNTINEIQDKRQEQYGNDYIEINEYVGARPLCSQDQRQDI